MIEVGKIDDSQWMTIPSLTLESIAASARRGIAEAEATIATLKKIVEAHEQHGLLIKTINSKPVSPEKLIKASANPTAREVIMEAFRVLKRPLGVHQIVGFSEGRGYSTSKGSIQQALRHRTFRNVSRGLYAIKKV